MDKIVVKASRLKLFIFFVCSLVFVASGFFIVFVEKKVVILGWITIIFFGAASLMFIVQLFDARPRLIIDGSGIEE